MNQHKDFLWRKSHKVKHLLTVFQQTNQTGTVLQRNLCKRPIWREREKKGGRDREREREREGGREKEREREREKERKRERKREQMYLNS